MKRPAPTPRETAGDGGLKYLDPHNPLATVIDILRRVAEIVDENARNKSCE